MNTGVYKNRSYEGSSNPMASYGQMTGGVEQSLIGAYGFIRAEQQRKKYEKLAVPQYSEDPAMQAARLRAENRAQSGFTPVQKAVFFNNLARMSSQRLHQGQELAGGSLGQALNAGNTANNLAAANNFAGQDAQLQQQNIQYADQFARNLQTIRNMNTQKDYTRYIATGAAITQAREDSLKNLVGGTQTFAGSGNSSLYGNEAGKKTEPQGTENDAWKNSYGGGYAPYGQIQDNTWGDQVNGDNGNQV